jgi:hypothetical protein
MFPFIFFPFLIFGGGGLWYWHRNRRWRGKPRRWFRNNRWGYQFGGSWMWDDDWDWDKDRDWKRQNKDRDWDEHGHKNWDDNEHRGDDDDDDWNRGGGRDGRDWRRGDNEPRPDRGSRGRDWDDFYKNVDWPYYQGDIDKPERSDWRTRAPSSNARQFMSYYAVKAMNARIARKAYLASDPTRHVVNIMKD